MNAGGNRNDDAVARFLAAVSEAARRYGMWRAGDKLLVAVSGGPDSVALLEALVRLAAEERLTLAIAHFHHGLRPEADAEAEFVRKLAADRDLPFFMGRGDAAAEARRMGRGVEAAARKLRLEFLERTAAEGDFRRIALGHTASDRVETVLMNLLRGAGLWGLRGIPPVREPYIRPLIQLWREDIEEFVAVLGLPYVHDRSNLDTTRFLRNKIRHRLLPLLEREYRAGARRAILRCAEAADQELEWTEPQVRQAAAGCAQLGARRLKLRIDELRQMPPGLQVRVLRYAVEQVFGPPQDWTWTHYAALQQAVRSGETGYTVELPGLQARVEYGWLVIRPPEQAPDVPERVLTVPGRVEIPEVGMVIEAAVVPRRKAGKPGPYRAILQRSLADEDLLVRTWRPGDRFRPLGMGGRTKKLQDFFTDEKLPAPERKRVLLVEHPSEGIIWVVGMRIAEGVAAAAGRGEEDVLVIAARPMRDSAAPDGEEV